MKTVLLTALLLTVIAPAQSEPRTAAELIAGVKAAKPAGGVYARLRLEHSAAGGAATTLQVQVKRRPAPDGGTDSLYQVLFPKERKGEGLLLHIKSGNFTGFTFTPGNVAAPLRPADRDLGLFGTAMTIDDIAAAFLDWPVQQIVGKAKEGPVPCAIVESRSGRDSSPTAPRVRSWIDEARYATMRIEKFAGSDTAVKTVITHKVMRGSSGYFAPASFTVSDRATGASTKVEGVRSASGITYTDADFAEAALHSVTAASGGKEE